MERVDGPETGTSPVDMTHVGKDWFSSGKRDDPWTSRVTIRPSTPKKWTGGWWGRPDGQESRLWEVTVETCGTELGT